MRTCIICGERAASREHVFPAALGGRRTNKGIYCAYHNNAFSKHAAKITEQLRHFNALLGVRPDHAKSAKPHQFTTEGGEQISVFNGEVRRVSPPVIQPPGMIAGHLEIGGPEALRAVGYIALTFFAQHYPDEVRLPEFDEFKAFVEHETANEYVWWEGPQTDAALPPNPFLFGHTIMLMVSPGTGNVTALVSFFQGMTFGVCLGRAPSLAAQSTVIFIDPHAENPPHDIRVQETNHCLLEIEKPEPLQSHLEQMVSENIVTDGISRLLARISRWKFETEAASVVQRLNAVRTQPDALRRELEEVLSELTSYVFRLLNYLAVNATDWLKDIPESKVLLHVLKEIATQDRSQKTGITPLTEVSIANAMDALIEEIEETLKLGEIDMEYLWRLFRTSYGVELVAPAVLAPILVALFPQSSTKAG